MSDATLDIYLITSEVEGSATAQPSLFSAAKPNGIYGFYIFSPQNRPRFPIVVRSRYGDGKHIGC
jgi:hypothetical protein